MATEQPATQIAETVAVEVSYEAAVEFGRMRAEYFGEERPQLMDAAEMPLAEAKRRVSLGDAIDGPVEGQSPVDGDDQVWLVRMRGSFEPPHQSPSARIERREGWMYTIVSAETGETYGSGIRTGDAGLR